jgi:hypothetical protein
MTLEFEYTAEDWRRSSLDLMRRRPTYWGCSAWFVLMALVGISVFRSLASIPFIIGCLFFALYLPLAGPRQAAKLSVLTPNTQGLMQFQIGTDGIGIQNACFSGHYTWAAFYDVVETNSGFVLYVGPAVYWLIPKRVFADAVQMDQFRGMVSQYKRPKVDSRAPIAAP